MKNYIKEGFKEDIIVEFNDLDLIKAGGEFINKLSYLNEEFVKDINKKEIEFEKVKEKGNKNIRYMPEALTKRSPLTIIDAKWGSGKTYFIEKLMENMTFEKIDNHNFQSAILVDAWKMSLSSDPLTELMAEIVSNLLEIYPNDRKEYLKKFASWTYFTGKTIWKNRIGLNPDDVNKADYVKALDKLSSKYKGYTLIFIDNLERVGREAWDILKAISKFLIVRGFVFVLPINLDKMYKVHEETRVSELENESVIEKYIDIKYFKFKQEYRGLLSNLGFELSDSKYYSNVLSEQNDASVLSIREIKKRIEGSGIVNVDDSDERKFLFQKNIWKSTKIYEPDLMDNIKILWDKMKDINDHVNNVQRKMEIVLINKYNRNSTSSIQRQDEHSARDKEIISLVNEFNKSNTNLNKNTLPGKISSIKSKVNNWKELMSAISKYEKERKKESEMLEREIDDVKEKIIFLQDDIENKNIKIGEGKLKVARLDEELTSLESGHKGNNISHQAYYQNIKKRYVNHNDEIEKLTNNLKMVMLELEEHKDSYIRLEGNLMSSKKVLVKYNKEANFKHLEKMIEETNQMFKIISGKFLYKYISNEKYNLMNDDIVRQVFLKIKDEIDK